LPQKGKNLEDQSIHFLDYIAIYPEIKPPVTLTDDSTVAFSKYNKQFKPLMISKFLMLSEKEAIDEFTEFVPCLQIPNTGDFYAVIYWKASLMNYQYILVTYDNAGNLVDKAIIAGTSSPNGEDLVRSVATIDEDWIITIVSGATIQNKTEYNPKSSKAFTLEILDGGKIISSE
jgi:hypothetical protein